jgi:hypothetical protein
MYLLSVKPLLLSDAGILLIMALVKLVCIEITKEVLFIRKNVRI